MNPKRSTPKYITVKTSKIKDRENSYSHQEWGGGRGMTYKGNLIMAVSLFFNRNFTDQKKVAGYNKC